MKKELVKLVFILSIIIFTITGIIVISFTSLIVKNTQERAEIIEFKMEVNNLRFLMHEVIINHSFYILSETHQANSNYNESKKNLLSGLNETIQTGNQFFATTNIYDSLKLLIYEEINKLDSVSLLNHSNKVSTLEIINKEIVKSLQKIDELIYTLFNNVELKIQNYRVKFSKNTLLIIITTATGYAIGFIFLVFSFIKLNNEIKKRKTKEKHISEQTETLRQLNKTKDTFFSIIAHDLKGPFTSLINLFDILNTALQEKDFSLIEENIYAIEFSARRTYNLLQNLLEWSKLQTGKISASPEYFDINFIIEENIDLFNEAGKQKNIKFIYTPKSQTVFADKNMISTVIRNIIQNAIKFTSIGSITIQTNKFEEYLNIKISDTGIGISRDDLKQLFRIDVDVRNIGTGADKGSGLGLILCKNFIEQNNGKIWADSELDKGSSFYIFIPLKRNVFLFKKEK